MAIIFHHRFLKRLLQENPEQEIKYVFIGTFNPASPVASELNQLEREEFQKIFKEKKYQKFNAVLNFYDRPPNRFWGIMDRLHEPIFYQEKGMKAKRFDGLKHYKQMDREKTFVKQKSFCEKNGILVTDIIRTIKPKSFTGIYDKFDDRVIDPVVSKWNTDDLIELIQKGNVKKVFTNFQINHSTIPNISREIEKLKANISIELPPLDSPSGSAGHTYANLVANWSQHISLHNLS